MWFGFYRVVDDKFYWVDGILVEVWEYFVWVNDDLYFVIEKCVYMYGNGNK